MSAPSLSQRLLAFDPQLSNLLVNKKVVSLTDGRSVYVLPGNGSQAQEKAPPNNGNTNATSTEVNEVPLRAATAPSVEFVTKEDRLKHYASDWHRVNLKRKTRGLPLLTKEQFQRGDFSQSSDEDTDGGSDSDSDSENNNSKNLDNNSNKNDVDEEDEEVSGPGSALITYNLDDGTTISTWKALINPNPKERHHLLSEYAPQISLFSSPSTFKQTAVFMLGGGRAACVLFDGLQVVAHKTIQRYTTRRKQGGSQSAHDNAKGPAKSAGAQIRRGQMLKFEEDVHNCLLKWKKEIQNCSRIFIVAPGIANTKILFGDFEGALSQQDTRVRRVPFTTSRATLLEAVRVHKMFLLVTVGKVSESNPALNELTKSSETVTSDSLATEGFVVRDPLTSSDFLIELGKSQEAIPTDVDLVEKAIKDGDVNALLNLFVQEYNRPLSSDGVLIPPAYIAVAANKPDLLGVLLDLDASDIDAPNPNDNERTALHKACLDDRSEMAILLLEHLADPTLIDSLNKTPYDLASSKTLRKTLRLFAGKEENKDLWPWNKAHIEPMGEDDEEKQRERKRLAAREKKVRDKQKKETAKKEKALEEQKQKQKDAEEAALIEAQNRAKALSNLSDREKRALAAERRLQSATGSAGKGKCESCGKDLPSQAFERLGYKYCTVECVAKHRAILDKLGMSSSQL